MKVLVCGGRDYSAEAATIWLERNAAKAVAEAVGAGSVRIRTIIHGCARGADEGAMRWGLAEQIEVLGFPANWKLHGRRAGPIRNQQMIEFGRPDVVIAFPGGRGTENMVRLAMAASIPVIRVPEGRS